MRGFHVNAVDAAIVCLLDYVRIIDPHDAVCKYGFLFLIINLLRAYVGSWIETDLALHQHTEQVIQILLLQNFGQVAHIALFNVGLVTVESLELIKLVFADKLSDVVLKNDVPNVAIFHVDVEVKRAS
jgi:hypothetical protein